jgi:hypothetical protein
VIKIGTTFAVSRPKTLRDDLTALGLGALGGTVVGVGIVFLIVWLVT